MTDLAPADRPCKRGRMCLVPCPKCADDHPPMTDLYVIKKNGVYYRPGRCGYTSNINEAGQFTLEDAERETHPNGRDGPRDGMTYEKAPMTNDLRKAAEAATPKPKLAPVQGYSAGIPWEMHLRAYDAYCKKYSPQQALIEGWCRGGFSVGELDMFIPGWRDELSELKRLTARVEELEKALEWALNKAGTDHPSYPEWDGEKWGFPHLPAPIGRGDGVYFASFDSALDAVRAAATMEVKP